MILKSVEFDTEKIGVLMRFDTHISNLHLYKCGEFVYYLCRVEHQTYIPNIYLYKYSFVFVKIYLPLQRFAPDERRKLIMKHETYKEALILEIIELLKKCNDISLLDLIRKLLKKSM